MARSRFLRARYRESGMPVAANRNDDLSNKPDYLKTVRNRTQAKEYGYPDKDKIQAHTKEYYSVVSEMDTFVGSILDKVEDYGHCRPYLSHFHERQRLDTR